MGLKGSYLGKETPDRKADKKQQANKQKIETFWVQATRLEITSTFR